MGLEVVTVWPSRHSFRRERLLPSRGLLQYPSRGSFFSAEGSLSIDMFKKFCMTIPEDQSDVLNTVAPPHLMLVCHGELNNVLWNEKTGPKKRVANEAADYFRTAHLLSVGEELIDPVSAWFANATAPKLQKLAKAFKNLQLLAHNPDNHDEIILKTTQQTNTAFERADGGQTWRLNRKPGAGNKSGPNFVPVQQDELQGLRALDAT